MKEQQVFLTTGLTSKEALIQKAFEIILDKIAEEGSSIMQLEISKNGAEFTFSIELLKAVQDEEVMYEAPKLCQQTIEECAKVCERELKLYGDAHGYCPDPNHCAAEIRKLKEGA